MKILVKSMGILSIDLDKINLDDDNNFDEDDPDTIIHARLLAWHVKFEKHKALKRMPVAWHPTRWWDWCLPEDEEKKKEIQFLLIRLC